MSFYIDAEEQRQKARRAEQRLLEHSQQRTPRPPVYSNEDAVVESSLPPVFRKEGYYAASRDTSIERRDSRFRDGLPPPPPPVPPGEIPRVLPSSVPPLVPPEEFERVRQQAPLLSLPALPATLTPSQKKRLRRKKKRLNGEASSPSPAPYPLAPDLDRQQQRPALPPPSPDPSRVPAQTACHAEIFVRMPNGGTHRIRCPLTPFPHPGQPHLVQLRSAQDDGAEIFLGFWLQGE